MTIRDMAARLERGGIDSALHEALLLAEHFTGRSYASLRADVGEPLTLDRAAENGLAAALERRCERYPLQYLLGEWEFMGLPFYVNEHCLIPRSDTEILCEYIIAHAPVGGRVLDLCTGSGCIAASVLFHRPDLTGMAVELYPETMAVAEENFRRLGLTGRIRALLGDATTDLLALGEQYDVIASNPPYVTAAEMAALEPELSAEPAHALTDGGDGLSVLYAMIDCYTHRLSADGFMILEHGATQSEAVIDYGRARGLSAHPLKDYGGNTRAAVLKKQP